MRLKKQTNSHSQQPVMHEPIQHAGWHKPTWARMELVVGMEFWIAVAAVGVTVLVLTVAITSWAGCLASALK